MKSSVNPTLICIGVALLLFTTSVVNGQSPAAPVVTGTVSNERVRFIAPSSVVQVKLEVISDAGASLFEAAGKGNVFDWTMQDGAGARAADGDYLCIVTVKSLSGKLSQRTGTVTMQGGRATLRAKTEMTAAQRSAVGPVEENAAITVLSEVPSAAVVGHDGKAAQLTSTTGDLTFRTGDVFAGTETERMRITEDGRVGIGTDNPESALDVSGVIMGRKGFGFSNGSTLNINEKGGLSLVKADGTLAPNAAGTGTINRMAKWTETGGAGTLGDSIAVDTGVGLQLTAAPNPSVDTNVISTSANDRTTGVIAGSTSAFLAGNGPYFALRGNSYTSLANQRGLFSISAGNVTSPVGSEGTILFFTGADQLRMVVKPSGNVGIGTATPTNKLTVLHGGGVGILNKSSAGFSSLDIDSDNGDTALRFARAGVSQWNIRNNPGTDDLEIFDQSGGGSRLLVKDGTGNLVQPLLSSSGLVKAAVATTGGATPTIARQFNNLPAGATATLVRFGAGTYEVAFGDDVSSRFYQGTIASATVSGGITGQIFISPRSGNVNALFIETRDSAGALADLPFQLVVY